MERLLAAMSGDPAAAVAGLAGMVCLAAWPLFHRRSAMLTVYVGNNLAFAVHYGLLGDWTAVAMNGVMAVQTVVAIWLVREPRLRWAYYALIPVLAGASVATWHGVPSLLAAAATMLSTAGRMQGNELVMRLLLLASTPVWTAHDLMVDSLPGLAADLLSMTIGATMLLRRSEIAAPAPRAAKRWFSAALTSIRRSSTAPTLRGTTTMPSFSPATISPRAIVARPTGRRHQAS